MKNRPISLNHKYLVKFILLFMISMIFSSCKEEPQLWRVDSSEQVIRDYIYSNPDQFSEFEKLVSITGMDGLLNVRGPFTLFLPDNDAMFAYYALKNVSSIDEFSDEFLEQLILNHLIAAFIPTPDFGLGALRETNAIGDYVVTEFQGSDIIVSKYSKVIDRDVICANGVIQVMDAVLDPVTLDIYSLVSSDPSYKIFSEGLSLTGLKDTLQIISFPYGNGEARNRFTLLAVPDSIYHRYEISTVDDLIEWTGANPDSVTYLSNPFYRYMEYHCMNGSYYLSDLITGIYPILSRDNNIHFRIDTDYKINYDKESDAYTGFIIDASNTPAKNGALHAINDLLPVTYPEPTTIIFETTDFFDIKQGDYYLNYYKRFFDGENTFAKIKWDGNYLLYYYKPIQGGILKHDALSMRGWWTVSVTFPKVMKGKYEVYVFQPGWTSTTDCVAYLDGELTPYTYRGPLGGTGGTGGLQKIADAVFTTTEEHTITLRCISAGALFWDYVQFTPVK